MIDGLGNQIKFLCRNRNWKSLNKAQISLLVAATFVFALNIQPLFAQVEPMLGTRWNTYVWPYNAYYPEDDNGINGHFGNACGPTAMSQMLKYWNHPANGYSYLEFFDNNGTLWSADFAYTEYDWDEMPYALGPYATEEEYAATATLMAHCAVAMHDIYGSGRSLEILKDQMVLYFRYSDEAEALYRGDHTPEEWDAIFRNELDNGRPIMIEGWGPGSAAPGEPGYHFGHYFICDGYDEEGNFHILWNMGGAHGYYPLYDFRDGNIDYSTYNWALIGFEPDLDVQVEESMITSNPDSPILFSAYPNPFNSSLKLTIELAQNTTVEIKIYNLAGQMVFRNYQRINSDEENTIEWNPHSLGSGIYICSVQGDGLMATQKVVLLK